MLQFPAFLRLKGFDARPLVRVPILAMLAELPALLRVLVPGETGVAFAALEGLDPMVTTLRLAFSGVVVPDAHTSDEFLAFIAVVAGGFVRVQDALFDLLGLTRLNRLVKHADSLAADAPILVGGEVLSIPLLTLL